MPSGIFIGVTEDDPNRWKIVEARSESPVPASAQIRSWDPDTKLGVACVLDIELPHFARPCLPPPLNKSICFGDVWFIKSHDGVAVQSLGKKEFIDLFRQVTENAGWAEPAKQKKSETGGPSRARGRKRARMEVDMGDDDVDDDEEEDEEEDDDTASVASRIRSRRRTSKTKHVKRGADADSDDEEDEEDEEEEEEDDDILDAMGIEENDSLPGEDDDGVEEDDEDDNDSEDENDDSD